MFKNATDFWQVVGQENPYWGVATHDKFLGTELSPNLSCEFFQSGAVEINSSLNVLHWLCGFKGTPGNAIDFGCGVGRLTIHMAKVMGHVYGVDISSGMLDKARKHIAENGLQNISFSTIIPDVETDWINSFIVFQHIPPKEGYRLLAELLSHLRGGGVFSLHFAIYQTGNVYKELGDCSFDGERIKLYDDFRVSEMPIYSYDASHVFKIIYQNNIGEFMVRHVDHGGLHGMWLFGRKND